MSDRNFSCIGVLGLLDCKVLKPGRPPIRSPEKLVDVDIPDGFSCSVSYVVKPKHCANLGESLLATELKNWVGSKVYLELRCWYGSQSEEDQSGQGQPFEQYKPHLEILVTCNSGLTEFKASVVSEKSRYNSRLSIFTAMATQVARQVELMDSAKSVKDRVLCHLIRDNMFPKEKRKNHNWNRLRDRLRDCIRVARYSFQHQSVIASTHAWESLDQVENEVETNFIQIPPNSSFESIQEHVSSRHNSDGSMGFDSNVYAYLDDVPFTETEMAIGIESEPETTIVSQDEQQMASLYQDSVEYNDPIHTGLFDKSLLSGDSQSIGSRLLETDEFQSSTENGQVRNHLHETVQTNTYVLDPSSPGSPPKHGDLVALLRNHHVIKYGKHVAQKDMVRLMVCLTTIRCASSVRCECAISGWVPITLSDYYFLEGRAERIKREGAIIPSTVWLDRQNARACVQHIESRESVLLGLVKHDTNQLGIRKKFRLGPNQLLVWIVCDSIDRGIDTHFGTSLFGSSIHSISGNISGKVKLGRKRLKTELAPKNPPSDRAYPLRKKDRTQAIKPGDVCAWTIDACVEQFHGYTETNNIRTLGALVVHTTYPDNPGAGFHRALMGRESDFVPCAVIGLVPVTITDPQSLELLSTTISTGQGWFVVGDPISGRIKLVSDAHVPDNQRLVVGRVVVSHSLELREEYQLEPNQVLCYVNVSNPMKPRSRGVHIYLAMGLALLFALTLVMNLVLVGTIVLRTDVKGSMASRLRWLAASRDLVGTYTSVSSVPMAPEVEEFHQKLRRNYKSFHMEAFAGNRNDPGGLTSAVLVESYAEIALQSKTSDLHGSGTTTYLTVDQFLGLHFGTPLQDGATSDVKGNRILVEGDAGVGKSSLLRLLAQTWAIQSPGLRTREALEKAGMDQGVQSGSQLLKKFDLVVLIPLVKLMGVERISPATLLSLCTTFPVFKSEVLQIMEGFILQGDLDILWLFDSVDETLHPGQKLSGPYSQFLDHLLGFAASEDPGLEWIGRNYIVTSQPGYFPELPRPPLQRWSLVGFKGPTGRNQYINTYFRNMENSAMVETVQHYFSVVSSHNQFGFAENPLLVQMVCYAFAMRPRLAKALRTNDQTLRTKVYSAVLTDLLFRRHLSRPSLYTVPAATKRRVAQAWVAASVELSTHFDSRYAPEEALDAAAAKALAAWGLDPQGELNLVEEFKQSGLFRIVPPAAPARREFAHQTFLDFFLARALVAQLTADLQRGTGAPPDSTKVPLLGDAAESPSLRGWMYSHNSVLAFFVDILRVDQLDARTRQYCLGRVFGPIQHTVRVRLLAGGSVAYSPLHWASRQGRTAVAEHLLEAHGADCFLRDWRGFTPRALADRHRHHELAQLLEECELAHLHAEGGLGRRRPRQRASRIQEAAGGGRRQVRQLVAREPGLVHAVDQNGETALHLAAAAGNAVAARALIESGADPTVKDLFEYTPLHKAASRGHLGAVRVICELSGAEALAVADGHGYTPLYLAALNRHAGIVRYLAGLGGQVPGQPRKAPLRAACKSGSLHIVEFLVEHAGEDVNEVDANGNSPLHFAAKNNHELVVKYLLQRGANPDTLNQWGASPLDVAVQQVQHEDIANDLIRAIKPSQWGLLQSAFIWASRSGNVCITKLLADRVDVNAKDRDGISALSWAAGNGELEICKYLLEYTNATVSGTSALEWASTTEISMVLQEQLSVEDESPVESGIQVVTQKTSIIETPIRSLPVSSVSRRLRTQAAPRSHMVLVFGSMFVVLGLLMNRAYSLLR